MLQKLKNYYHLIQAFFSALYFNFPSKKLTVIGITGTDGKTTTVSMIYHILKSNGYKVSMINSVNAQIGAKKIDTGFHVTTPSPFQIQKLLRKAADSGSEYFVLEATSHGLDQNRLAFINFEIAAITNITHEHLDYHKKLENYVEAKAKLFKHTRRSILNIGDNSYQKLKKLTGGKLTTYGFQEDCDLNPQNFKLNLKIPGVYNRLNALAASAVCLCLDIPKRKIQTSLSTFSLPKGRMEKIDYGQKFKVYIDFAHTPNALAQALAALKSEIKPGGKLIAVFGAAGMRDKSKRPMMGEAAANHGDFTVITAEDPRSENVTKICQEIADGLIAKGKKEDIDFKIIPDRSEAIKFAISAANQNDTVGFFGKGHEKSMAYGRKEIEWDEFAEVKKTIKRGLNAKR